LKLVDRLQRWITEPPPDHLFEITETALATVSPRTPNQSKHEILTERALEPSPAAPNVLQPQLYRQALTKLSPNPLKRTAAVVIPDYAVRMAILDFEEFPAGEEERMALLRFRLRKTVPFHIEGAQLAYSIQVDDAKQVEVLAVAIARPILDEYESIFTEAGYRVGLVTPSSLASLWLCARQLQGIWRLAPSLQTELTLLAKAAGSTLSVLLLEQSRLRLVRSLDFEGSDDEMGRDGRNVLPLLQQTLAYAEDQIGESVGRLLLCGFGTDTEALGKLAQGEFGVPYAQVRSRFGVAVQENAGLLGLLEQYAA